MLVGDDKAAGDTGNAGNDDVSGNAYEACKALDAQAKLIRMSWAMSKAIWAMEVR